MKDYVAKVKVDIDSACHVKMLLDRIERTLGSQCPGILAKCGRELPALVCDDDFLFDGLCRAVFSANAGWNAVEKNWTEVKAAFRMLKVRDVAGLSDKDLDVVFTQLSGPLAGAMNPEDLRKKIRYARDDAECVLRLAGKHVSFSKLIGSFLTKDTLGNQVIDPARENAVIGRFTDSNSKDKLRGVGLAIFCEFCKNIGIDEFKPDRHTKRFFHRIGLLAGEGSEMDCCCRSIGIALARAAGQRRAYVDSLIWNFCADGRGEICRKVGRVSKCSKCKLRTEEPVLCSHQATPIPTGA